MNCERTADTIIGWLQEKDITANMRGFVVNVSGGIDSAVVSSLCVMTGLPTKLLMLPIYQKGVETDRAMDHCTKLCRSMGVTFNQMNLRKPYEETIEATRGHLKDRSQLSEANLRSRMRMQVAYMFANSLQRMVVGTGNKVEDYGVGFFTKYGDGGVDLSPIGNLTKTQVFELGTYLKVNKDILEAAPTDGLFNDGRTDEDQLGATYPELEEAMAYCEELGVSTFADYIEMAKSIGDTMPNALVNYLQRHEANAHKMAMPPIGPEAIL